MPLNAPNFMAVVIISSLKSMCFHAKQNLGLHGVNVLFWMPLPDTSEGFVVI